MEQTNENEITFEPKPTLTKLISRNAKHIKNIVYGTKMHK